jgi:hypothetical protein
MMSKADLDRHLNTVRWTISNRTNAPLPYTITGVAHSPVRQHCIVLYTQLPEEVAHLHFPVRRPTLEALGIDEPDEGWEDSNPVIIVNKMYGARNMSEMNKYSFFRNFCTAVRKDSDIDVFNPHSARHLIGRKLVSKFVQMRKLNTEQRFWAVDRVGMGLTK